MAKVTRREWYRRVNGLWPETVPAITAEEAERAARRLYRFGMGRTWTGEVRITSGNRNTWVRRGVLVVNPDQGWKEVVHLLSHYCFHRTDPDAKSHSAAHARAEMRMIREVLKREWLDGRLRTEVKASAPAPTVTDLRAQKRQRIEERIARWESKLTRAERALAKLRRSHRYYVRVATSSAPPSAAPSPPS